MKIIKKTFLPGVGAAVLLLSAFASGSSTAAPASSAESAGSAVAGVSEVRESAASEQTLALPVSIVSAMRDDGTVDFQVARFVRASANNRTVRAIDELVHTAVLAPDAVFLSTMGCDPDHSLPPSVDQQGLGTIPCDWASYSAMTPQWSQYAPAIFYNDAGEISKMANHYHP